jgi:hypothetical protein
LRGSPAASCACASSGVDLALLVVAADLVDDAERLQQVVEGEARVPP